MIAQTPPDADEFEISVFGKGIGECCVVHVGYGKWITIDSILDDHKRPIALGYLDSLDIAAEAIELIVLTHWHDDHIRGAARVLKSATNAAISYSTVLRRDEFKAAIERVSPSDTTTFTSGVRELAEIASLLRERPRDVRLGVANRVIYRSDTVRIETLSPSDDDLTEFFSEIFQWGVANDTERVITVPNRNDTSVAVVIETNEDLLLFGADLEVRGKLSGWQAVHDLYWGSRGKCSFYKIAHHGSVTGHFDPKWANMLNKNVAAVLTPYGRGRKKLPDPTDVKRITSLTDTAYSAGAIDFLKGRTQISTVEKTLREANIKLERLSDRLGQIRLRKKVGEKNWRIEVIGEALQLQASA